MPGLWFDSTGPNPAKLQMFFVFYFIMTGLHALHMIIGLGLLRVTTVAQPRWAVLRRISHARRDRADFTGTSSTSSGCSSTRSSTSPDCTNEPRRLSRKTYTFTWLGLLASPC